MTRIVARHPVLAIMAISLGGGFLTAAVRPITEVDVLPFGMPLHGFLGVLIGVGLAGILGHSGPRRT